MKVINTDKIINKFIHPRPRLICTCGNFKPYMQDEMAWYRCIKCGGWMSRKMIHEQGL
jgi:hypothetical protein